MSRSDNTQMPLGFIEKNTIFVFPTSGNKEFIAHFGKTQVPYSPDNILRTQ